MCRQALLRYTLNTGVALGTSKRFRAERSVGEHGSGVRLLNQFRRDMLPMFSDIVIVQAEKILREVMSEAFSNTGARVYAFSTADEAMRHLLAEKKPCALVVSDQRVPGELQGEELLARVHDRWPSVMAILISAYKVGVIKRPPTAVFLQKPWCIDDLMEAAASVHRQLPLMEGKRAY